MHGLLVKEPVENQVVSTKFSNICRYLQFRIKIDDCKSEHGGIKMTLYQINIKFKGILI